MVVILPRAPVLQPNNLVLFSVLDERLGKSPLLVFYGPSSTAYSSGSRIQAHIFSPGGNQSYPRLAVSPSSPLYAAVEKLPREEQGDEICRGLAFSIYKYFGELSDAVKTAWKQATTAKSRLEYSYFSQVHAAELAARMTKVQNIDQVCEDLNCIFGEQSLSWLDLDLVLPSNAFQASNSVRSSTTDIDELEDERTERLYGKYASLAKTFGQPAFLPTSTLRRAPSRLVGIARSKSFSRRQKENIRREMCELLDTEESYVGKIYDLVYNVASDFRKKAKVKDPKSSSPSPNALMGLFPPSLDEILALNTDFLEDVRKIVEDTENDAIKDIEVTMDEEAAMDVAFENGPSDVTGALQLANCLLSWLPKFQKSYTAYMQAHAGFPKFLKNSLKETGSSFSKRVHETGEQQLMSMLIEPVQRLPRYNLYIESIVKHLPVRHAAVKPLFKARDIISETCSEDGSSTKQINMMDRLHKSIGNWPSHYRPQSRVVSAVDVDHVNPPFSLHRPSSLSGTGVLLILTDGLIILHKVKSNALTSRGLIAALESSDNLVLGQSGRTEDTTGLQYHKTLDLSRTVATEMDEGKALRLSSQINESQLEINHLILKGSYEGRAAHLTKDLCRARIEGRFTENERDSDKWECRSVVGELGMFAAIHESSSALSNPNRTAATVSLSVDLPRLTPHEVSSHGQRHIRATLNSLASKQYLLEVNGPTGTHSQDRIAETDLLPVFIKRLTLALQSAQSIHNPSITNQLVTRNLQMLGSLTLKAEPENQNTSHEWSMGPSSPVKLLSSLFGGAISSIPKKTFSSTNLSNYSPRTPVPASPSKIAKSETTLNRSIGSISKIDENRNEKENRSSSVADLEQNLSTYMLALHSRKGNVVGRVLRARKAADQTAVSELYGALLNRPDDHAIAAQASVDVLFSAFEKFLKGAWKMVVGDIMPAQILRTVQDKADQLPGMDFVEYFRSIVADMAPQNQRAIGKLVKLLTDLLDGASNDGDRGMLTASFAEVLVPDGEYPLNYISLLDRLVDNRQLLFGETSKSGATTPKNDSIVFESKPRSGNLGSISSNTSSLRKKFGLGTLSRENSKADSENKSPSVWRTLSKSARGLEAQYGSLSKGTVSRTKSTESDLRPSPKRPMSRDRPNGLGAFKFESPSYDGKIFPVDQPLGVSNELEVPLPTGPPRKKRRSSLSDLAALTSGNNTPSWSPLTPRKQESVVQQAQARIEKSPRTPSPTKPSNIPALTQSSVRSMKSTPNRKEDSPMQVSPRRYGTGTTSTSRLSNMRSEECKVPALNIQKRTNGLTGIPSLKPATTTATNVIGALSERPTGGNSLKPPPSSPEKAAGISTVAPTTTTTPSTTTAGGGSAGGSPQKLRMQSPQKLRRRLQNEQKALGSAEASLQAELNKIEEEMSSSLHPRTNRTVAGRPTSSNNSSSSASGTTASITSSSSSLHTRLKSIESKTTAQINEVKKSIASLALDLTTSLEVSEERAKKLDELYREAVAENETLSKLYNADVRRMLGIFGDADEDGEGRGEGRIEEEEEEGFIRGRRALNGMNGLSGKVGMGEEKQLAKKKIKEEEYGKKMREMGDELVAARKEAARLKRENAGLKALVRKE